MINFDLLFGILIGLFYALIGLGVSRAVGFNKPVFEMLLWPVVIVVVAIAGRIEYEP